MTSHSSTTEPLDPPARAPRTRRRLAAMAFVAVGVGTLAAPVADAAPAPAAPIEVSSKARIADPIADQAGVAFATLGRYVETGDAPSLASYEQQRDDIAVAVAARLGIDPARMQTAWRTADIHHQQALMSALTQLGVPYRRNTSKPGVSFDCSGLTTYAWGQAGYTLTRQSSAQIRAAEPRTADTAQAGDIVQYPGHVMMWLGVDNTIVHAVGSGRSVELDTTSRKSVRFGDPTA